MYSGWIRPLSEHAWRLRYLLNNLTFAATGFGKQGLLFGTILLILSHLGVRAAHHRPEEGLDLSAGHVRFFLGSSAVGSPEVVVKVSEILVLDCFKYGLRQRFYVSRHNCLRGFSVVGGERLLLKQQ